MEEVPAGSERIQVGSEMPAGVERRLVLRLLGHWRSLCGDRGMPALPDLDPAAIPEIWPHSFVVQIDQAGGAHTFQAVGDQIEIASSQTLAGKQVTEADPNALSGIALAYLDEVLKKGVPVSRGGEFTTQTGSRVLYRSVLVPLSDDGTTISGILGAANCREVVEN